MLDVINRYAHGFVAVPVILACKQQGLFKLLASQAPLTSEDMARHLNANEGHLMVALRLMQSLGWLMRNENGQYVLTLQAESHQQIPPEILDLYDLDMVSYLGQEQPARLLRKWIDLAVERWGGSEPLLADFLDGVLVIPLLLALHQKDELLEGRKIWLSSLAPLVGEELSDLFVGKGWAHRQQNCLLQTDVGQFLLERALIMGTTASYKPMLTQIDELLFGEPQAVLGRDQAGHELHIDRTLNVVGSGFQHGKFFADVDEIIIELFSQPLAEQPNYVADMGCGDGTFLARVYDVIRTRSERGQMLNEHPVVMIGIDYNQRALDATTKKLVQIPHLVLRGDIGDPEQLVQDLQARGVNPNEVLHIRSFLDHERPFLPPTSPTVAPHASHEKRVAQRTALPYEGVYVDERGEVIPPPIMVQGLVEHLARWARLESKHGLILLEVHCLPPKVVAEFRDECENLHFDAYHAFSGQYLVEADVFLISAAEVGLLPKAEFFRRYPSLLPFSRITLNCFEKKPYQIRLAHHDDLPALLELEEQSPKGTLSQPETLRASAAMLEERIEQHPTGHCVLSVDDEIVGVIYTQRLDDSRWLAGKTDRSVTTNLRKSNWQHDPQGNAVMFLSINLLPDISISLGKQFLQFMQLYCKLKSGVTHLIGVAECERDLGIVAESIASRIAQQMHEFVADYPLEPHEDTLYPERELEAFGVRWLLTIFQKMGVMKQVGETWHHEDLKIALNIIPKYYRLFDALLIMFERRGLLSISNGTIKTQKSIDGLALQDLQAERKRFRQTFVAQYPTFVAFLDLMDRSLADYDAVLTGTREANDVIFPEGSMDLFAGIFTGDKVADYFNHVLAEIVLQAIQIQKERPNSGKIRILEIGAGTGGATTFVLDKIQVHSEQLEFYYTDISSFFTRYGKSKFATAYPWVNYQTLNIEGKLEEQGVELGTFDIIYASNVLHDTQYIRYTLRQIKKLLKPGGIVALNEFTRMKDLLLFTGGLLHGWWLFANPENRLDNTCLLGVEQWEMMFNKAGFANFTPFLLPFLTDSMRASQSVMMCELPIAASPSQALPSAIDTQKKMKTRSNALDHSSGPRTTEVVTTDIQDVKLGNAATRFTSIAEAVKEVITMVQGEERRASFSLTRPLMEMGLDSLQLLELRALLNRRLGIKLDPTFFFRYGSAEAIINHLTSSPEERGNGEQVVQTPRPSKDHYTLDRLAENAGNEAIPSQLRPSSPSSTKNQPIAIIGMACRFPGGVSSPAEFWSLLYHGGDAISEVPQTRWDIDAYYGDEAGQIRTRYGGFLDQVDRFDASFFRIAPVEASAMDPQQRLLLETHWEALENAGMAPDSLAGSEVGIYVGIFDGDYKLLQVKQNSTLGPYYGSGTATSIAAGRVAYFLGLSGPAVAINTACSSSLVALHLACQSLQSGESNLALASGVNILLSPELSITYSQANMLAPDGRCKTFDAAADGYVRSEGCGVVVLKRLSDALADGDHILALIKGTAINQDGASNGLTAPNGLAQEAVIQKSLSGAGIEPHSVSYIEAHGTGTSLGDPVEIKALEAVYLKGRPENNPLIVGSVKTNIGHTEAAAGMAGLLKVILSMQHHYLPPHLHFSKLNPHLQPKNSIVIPSSGMAWERDKLVAGISSFGFSGTNAHVILEEAPTKAAAQVGDIEPFAPKHALVLSPRRKEGLTLEPHLFTLSAKSEQALRQLTSRYADYLAADSSISLANVCFTVNTGRAHFEHRLAVVAPSTNQLRERLEAFATGEEQIGLVHGLVSKPKVAFLFTGQGSQYVDMGRELYETQPTFRQALAHCEQIWRSRPYLSTPLLNVLYPSEEDTQKQALINETAYTQPALFALEYALAKMWQSWGIEPDVVMGHSVGELVAACVAGVFSLEDGLKLIAERGRLMQALPQNGAMMAVLAPEPVVTAAIAPDASELSIAAINGPKSVVISGSRQAVHEAAARLPEGVRTIPLTVSHAFHSPLMEPMGAEFLEVARDVTFSLPQIKMISNLTGEVATSDICSSEYWGQHIRQPVRFADGMKTLHEMGIDIFVEIGPASTLLGMGRQVQGREGDNFWLPSLRPRAEWSTLLASVAQLYVQGVEIDWAGFYRGKERQKVVLLTYAFQRQRYWLSQASQDTQVARRGRSQHPLLGQRVRSAAFKHQEIQFEVSFSLNSPHLAYLADHRVYQQAVLPAAAYLEMALAAGASVTKSSDLVIDAERVIIQEALVLPDGADNARIEQTIQVILTPETHAPRGFSFQIYSLATDEQGQEQSESPFRLHASGRITPRSRPAEATQRVGKARETGGREVPVTAFYQECSERRLNYGPRFQALTELWLHEGEALAKIEGSIWLEQETYHLHPALLDACFQLGLATLAKSVAADGTLSETYLPIALESLHFYRQPGLNLWSRAKRRATQGINQDVFTVDFHLYDEQGTVATIEGLSLKRTERVVFGLKAARTGLSRRRRELREWLYEVEWQPKPLQSSTNPTDISDCFFIFTNPVGIVQKLASHIKERGVTSVLVSVSPDEGYHQLEKNHSVPFGYFQINPSEPDHWKRLLQESGPYDEVIYLWGLDTSEMKEELRVIGSHPFGKSSRVVHLVQALAQADWDPSLCTQGHYKETPARLWLVTKGAQSVTSSESLHVEQAPLWGVGQVITLEHPELHCVRLDLDPSNEADHLQALLRELSQRDASQWSKDNEDQVAYRQGVRHVARLVRFSDRNREHDPAQTKIVRYTGQGSYLITGGLGGLGLQVAHWLVEQGAKQIYLIGRRGAEGAVREIVGKLAQKAEVRVLQADVSNYEEMAKVLAEIDPPLRGVIHAAGVLDDGVLQQQSVERFEKVLLPKVQGTWNLHKLTEQMALDFFVCFSSVASLLGTLGQGNYAAANRFMDALAHHRQALGLPALSINWGPWANQGMVAELDSRHQQRFIDRGLNFIPPQEGLEVLGQLLGKNVAQVAVLPVNWSKLIQQYQQVPPFLDYFHSNQPSENKQSEELEKVDVRQQLEKVPMNQRHAFLLAHVNDCVANVLGAREAVNPKQGFFKMGMDSIMSVELRNQLQTSLGCSLPQTLAFNYPTVEELTHYLASEVLSLAPDSEASLSENQENPEHPAPAFENDDDKLFVELEDLSDENLEDLLLETLDQLGF